MSEYLSVVTDGVEVLVAPDGYVRIRMGSWDADFAPSRARQLAALITACADWSDRHPVSATND